jgi:hypothetical protein
MNSRLPLSGQVVRELMAISARKCPQEVAEHYECLRGNSSTGCEHTDEAALNCAAVHVITAAKAMAKQGGR